MPETTPLRPGDPRRIGPYVLNGRLGTGGQGTVYHATAPSGEPVAIKWIRPDLTGDDANTQRFLREVAAAKRVAAFCTAQILDTGVEFDRPYIVSEYVDGPSLQQTVLSSGPIRGNALYRLAIGTTTALAAIHRAGIVHRDFKPPNVLMGPDGVRVIDFGISRALDVTSTLTSVPIGTPAYMAPEQFLNQEIGPATDMFAWASTMVFAANGKPPFAADALPVVINRILNAEPEVRNIDGRLRDLVLACLDKTPANRPTAQQVMDALLVQSDAAPAAAPGSGPDGSQSTADAPSSGGGPRSDAQDPGRARSDEPAPAPVPTGPPAPGSPGATPQPATSGRGNRPEAPPPSGFAAPRPPAPTRVWPRPAAPAEGTPATVPPFAGGASGAPASPPPLAPEPVTEPGRRGMRPSIKIIVAACVAVAAIGAGVYTFAPRDGRHANAADVKVSTSLTPASRGTASATAAPASPSPVAEPSAPADTVPQTGLVQTKLPGVSATLVEHPADPVSFASYQVDNDKDETEAVYLRASRGGAFKKYSQYLRIDISPNGEVAAGLPKSFREGYDTVDLIDLKSGHVSTVRTVRDSHEGKWPQWSRDGRRLLLSATQKKNSKVVTVGFIIVDVAAKTARVVYVDDSAIAESSFGWNGEENGVVALFKSGKTKGLRFYDLSGKAVRDVTGVENPWDDARFLFSPSGDTFLTTCADDDDLLCAWDARTGEMTLRVASACSRPLAWYDEEHLICYAVDDGDKDAAVIVNLKGDTVRAILRGDDKAVDPLWLSPNLRYDGGS